MGRLGTPNWVIAAAACAVSSPKLPESCSCCLMEKNKKVQEKGMTRTIECPGCLADLRVPPLKDLGELGMALQSSDPAKGIMLGCRFRGSVFSLAEVKGGDDNPYARTTGSKRDAHGI